MRDHYEQRSSYELAREWLSAVRSERRWEQLGWLTSGIANRISRKREAIEQELLPRFEAPMTQTLTAAGCTEEELPAQALMCMLRLRDTVNADPKRRCLPELLWEAVRRQGTVPAALAPRLELRFHLYALLDELPSSDERGALREFVFGGALSSAAGVRQAYPARRGQVERGLDEFAAYLHRKRDRVAQLTNGAIRSSQIATLEDAQDLVMENIGIRTRGRNK